MPHQPEDACWEKHCCSHGEDEEQEPCYLRCGECYHVFPTAAGLVDDHNAEVQVMMTRWGGELLAASAADEIFSCPWCSHDF